MFKPLEKFINSLKLEADQALTVSVTNIDRNTHYAYNETESFYPASLIKLFATFLALTKINKKEMGEFSFNDLNVAIRNSLADSDNDALSLVYDFISSTSSGLYDKKTFSKFCQARNAISEYFHELGFSDKLALHNKCYSFAPYGKDLKLFLGQGSNKLMLSDVEKIMQKIINEKAELLEAMIRSGDCEQSEFIYKGLDASKLDFFYSKAAWTSSVRHDAAYFSYNKEKYLFIVLTRGLSENKGLIPELTEIALN